MKWTPERLSMAKVRRLYREGGFIKVLEACYTIIDKDKRKRTIVLNDEQRDFVKKCELQLRTYGFVRQIILKARQLGFSTIIEGMLMVWPFLKPNSLAIVLSHESKSAKNLYKMMDRGLDPDNWPWGDLSFPSHRMEGLVFDKPIDSTVEVMVAGNVGSGRSFTPNFLHASECAFYPDAETLMLGILQGVPDQGSMVFLESTANGMGNWFHKKWVDSQNGKGDFEGNFYPWQDHRPYRREFVSDKEKARFLDSMTEKERGLANLFGLDLEQLYWRRKTLEGKCSGDEKKFQQEYPMTPEEAFIASGRTVFDADGIQAMLKHAQDLEPAVQKGYLEEMVA